MNNKEITFMDILFTGDQFCAIERSEKREQCNVIQNQRLPIKANNYSVSKDVRYLDITDTMDINERMERENKNNKVWTTKQYEEMGIKIIEEHDDLFLNVILPDGWKIKGTGHSMWNEVFDNKNRKRITFFYKGVFYDRDAFSNFEQRYTYSEMPFDEYKTDATYEERQAKEWYGIVYDCGKEIFKTKGIINKGYFDDSLKKQCIEYLNENYPLWGDINAYWND